IEAISSLSDREKEKIELHWFGKANTESGPDSELGRAKEAIKKFGLTEQVFLHPATDRIHDEMSKSDFVSLFSFREGLPNAILEGMALKKPIVMSKVSDYAVLVDEENGFLCDPADPTDIAKAIRAALSTTSEQRAEMGARSYEKLLSICSKDVIVRKWLELIES
ncbi:MAG: glycosyltransferase family 4 protein, partial [Clostridia bacterium]|nr:glycosyltransferase family 4 protein [Clostridia bacterium]